MYYPISLGFDFQFIRKNYSLEIVIFCCSLLISFVLQQCYQRWTKPFPPGPWGLPFVGFRPFLGRTPYKKFKELSKKYGPVMGFSVGSLKVVVFNDFDSMMEVYRKDESLGRPAGTFYNYSKYENLVNMNGPLWKEHRKFFSGFFRNFLRVDSVISNLHDIFAEETTHLLSAISKVNKYTTVNIRELIRAETNNTMLRLVFGVTLPDEHHFIKDMSDQQKLLLKQALVTDWTLCLPKLSWLIRKVLPEQHRLKESCKLVEDFIGDQIECHKKTIDPENPKDFIDHSLLRERLIPDKSVYSDGIMNSNIQVILTGGTDTTRTSVEWAFMLMAKFPEIQEKIFLEINRVFDREQKPKWEDRYQLPYTMAAIMECQRWKTIVPLSLAKLVVADFSIRGYLIPKGTVIMGNIWAIHNDETYWKNPSEFNPEHYLTNDGNLDLNKRFMAFSSGKRDCPGKNQAMMELFLFIVAVLQKYKILPSEEGVSLDEDLSIVAGPVKPFVIFEARN